MEIVYIDMALDARMKGRTRLFSRKSITPLNNAVIVVNFHRLPTLVCIKYYIHIRI